MKNYIKVGILFLGVTLTFSHCKDITSDNSEQDFQTSIFQPYFNPEAFSEVIPYEFDVDWSQPIKAYSKELQSTYYEFSVIWTTQFNPDVLGSGFSTYKIIALANQGSPEFYVLKMLERSDIKTKGLSWADLKDFSGRLYLFNT